MLTIFKADAINLKVPLFSGMTKMTSTEAQQNYRILVVDDNMMIRQMVTAQLNKLGYTDIEKAVNGADAFAKLEAAYANGKPFNITFLDWNMPELNGFEVLRKCRMDARFMPMPIIMLSAESEQRNILQALKAGATSYIIKPLTPEILEKKMAQVVQLLVKQASIVPAVSHA